MLAKLASLETVMLNQSVCHTSGGCFICYMVRSVSRPLTHPTLGETDTMRQVQRCLIQRDEVIGKIGGCGS